MGKVTIKKLQDKFRDANECISAINSKFNMKDYDIDSVEYDGQYEAFFINKKNGNEAKMLYDCETKTMAEIIN